MSTKQVSISGLFIVTSTVLLILFFTARHRREEIVSREENSHVHDISSNLEKEAAPSTSSATPRQSSCRLYVMPEEPVFGLEPEERFGFYMTSHSMGVPEAIADQFELYLPDFLTIGEQSVDRFQFMQSQGVSLEEGLYWKTWVKEIGPVAGQLRVLVSSVAGKDLLGDYRGGVPYYREAKHMEDVAEIWQLSADQPPVLLDRIRAGFRNAEGKLVTGFDGLHTQAEAPLEVLYANNN